jgi:hypothetical protein
MSDYLDENALAALGPLDSDDVPLRQALAMFLSDDIDEAGVEITTITNNESAKYRKYFIICDSIFFLSALAIISVFLTLAFSQEISTATKSSLLDISFGSLLFAAIPRILAQAFQYGWVTPENRLALAHPADNRIDEFLALLQKESGPKGYCYSVF